jgi:micrococcal nuclease
MRSEAPPTTGGASCHARNSRPAILSLALLLALSPPQAITCVAIDGDSLHCRTAGQRGFERIRLIAIDAPEMPGHCRPGRRCVPGDPVASKASLARALGHGPIAIRRFGQDAYGRTLAMVSAGRTDLACWQLTHRQAVYRAAWDTTRGSFRSRCRA